MAMCSVRCADARGQAGGACAGGGGPVQATVSRAPHTSLSPFAAANGTTCAANFYAQNKHQQREET